MGQALEEAQVFAAESSERVKKEVLSEVKNELLDNVATKGENKVLEKTVSEPKVWVISEMQRRPGNALVAVCGVGILVATPVYDHAGTLVVCETSHRNLMGLCRERHIVPSLRC